MKKIPLTQNRFVLVDDEDFDSLAQFHWNLSNGYATRRLRRLNGRQRDAKMHRDIIKPPAGMQVDHINGNKLDNRRSNLRLASARQNRQNRPAPKHNTSGFKGVSYRKDRGTWMAQIKDSNGKHRHLGTFSSPTMAAKTYDVAAIKYFGEFAWLNFERKDYDPAPNT